MTSPLRLLGPVLAGNVIFGAGLYVHALLYNFYLQGLGLPESAMGLAAAALTAGSLTALAPAGLLVDRRGSRPAFALAVMLDVAGLATGALVTSPGAVYAAAFLAGLGTGCWQVTVAPTLMDLAPSHLRARVFSLNVGLLVGSGALWTAGAGWLADVLEPGAGSPGVAAHRGALLVGAALTAASLPLFVAVPAAREAPRSDKPPASPRRGALSLPTRLIALAALVTVWMMGAAVVQPFMNLYFDRTQGLGIGGIGGLFAASHAVTALVVLGSGEMAHRLGTRPLLGGWVGLFAGSLALLATPVAAPLAVGLFFLFQLVGPATNPLIDQLLQERAPLGQRGAVSAWRNAAAGVSGLAGAAGGGWLLQTAGFPALFASAAIIGLLGGTGLVLGASQVRPAPAAPAPGAGAAPTEPSPAREGIP